MKHCQRHANRFFRDKGGNAAIIFSVAMVPLVGAVGLAFDYARWHYQQSRMQSAADAAALAGVNTYVNSLYAKKKGKTTAKSIALTTVQNYVTAQGQTQNQSISGDFSDTPPTVGVEIDGVGKATFTKLLGATDANISAKSVAVTSANTTAACVIGLEASASLAVNFQLSGNFTANDCAVWSNSTQSIALSGSSGRPRLPPSSAPLAA